MQILNRTNNIFELVTVEPVLHDKPPDRGRQEMLLSDELDVEEDRNLRLKGKKSLCNYVNSIQMYRTNDLHGQLEDDDVSWDSCYA